MAKTEFLQIRITSEDRARLRRAAAAEYLDVSTWARSVLLKAIAQWERRHRSRTRHDDDASKKVNEPLGRVAEPHRDASRRGKA